MDESQYLEFRLTGDTGKTKRWDVVSKNHGDTLGRISWFGRWRQYCFFPVGETVWNAKCLSDVQEFINVEMKRRG